MMCDRDRKAPLNRVNVKNAILLCISSVVIYNVVAFAYVINSLRGTLAEGEFGAVLALNERLMEVFPRHSLWVQNLVLLPLPNAKATRYYESQREVFEEAARNFEIHPYFELDDVKENLTFRQVVHKRIQTMYDQFIENGSMDYRLEKDRCAMFEFLSRNKIKHPKVAKMWYTREKMISDVTSGKVTKMMKNWPIFFKACHLTQRSSGGTFAVKDSEKYEEVTQDIVNFVNDKWVYRSRDVDRPWQKEGDAITDALTPSFLVQEPMQLSDGTKYAVDGRMSVGLVEVRAEVIWGRVYLVNLDASAIFLRDGNVENYAGFIGGVLKMPPEGNARINWVRDEGYLDCVIETSELLAKLAHVEYVRVDIWIDRGNPAGCQVNEISLSSGYVYYGHEKYMAKLWSKPFQTKDYKVFKTSKPVHMLSRRDTKL